MKIIHLAHNATDNHALDPIEPTNEWLRAHGLNPNHIYRFEIHSIDIDTPVIRVFELLRNADDRLYCGLDHVHPKYFHQGCEVARRDPYDVPLRVEPPAELVALHAHPEEDPHS
jgi:hypothetical protein